MADDLAAARIAAGLRILNLAGQRVDDIAGEMSAVGRGQRRVLLALEVIMQDEFAAVAGKNEIDTGTLELCAEQQMRVGNDNGVRRNVRGVNRFGINVTARVLAQRIRNRGIKFAGVIHPRHRNG